MLMELIFPVFASAGTPMAGRKTMLQALVKDLI